MHYVVPENIVPLILMFFVGLGIGLILAPMINSKKVESKKRFSAQPDPVDPSKFSDVRVN